MACLKILFCVALCLMVWTGTTSGLVIYHIYPRVGSLAGGTTVSVYGSGFSTDSYNSVNIVLLGTIPCRVRTYTVNQNRLECVTDPYPDAEEGLSYPRLQSAVLSEGQTHITTGGNDAFTYHWSYTPQIWKVEPSAGPVGTQVEVGGYRFTWNYNDYSQFFIGDQVCELRDSQNNRQFGIRYKWPLYYVKCLTTETLAGGWNATTMLSGVRGRTWNHSQALYPVHDWSLAMYELYPDIHGVSPQVGSPSGGTLLTITGTGFSGDTDSLEVDVNGVPCQVVSHTSTEIQCWTGAPPSDSVAIANDDLEYPITDSGYRFRGSRGVRVFQYRGIGGGTIDNLRSSNKYPDNPDYIFTYPSFSTGPDIFRHNSYGERLMAFFNPHSSGRHTFYATNDDQGEIRFAPGNNITVADQNSIVSSTRVTGFSNYERYNQQKSDILTLEEDEDYLLIGEIKEGGGGEYLTVGAKLHDEIDYNYRQTKQAVREKQTVTLSSAGLYDVQTLRLAVNRSAIKEDAPPHLVVEWGGRASEPVPLLSLQGQPEILGAAVLDLFSGQCEFDVVHGVNHYPAPNGFDFEGGVRSDEAWSSWNGSPPVLTEEEALCGRHSLYVGDSRAQAFTLADNAGKKTSDFPFICLGYKLPRGHSMALAVNVKDYGWWSIPLSDLDTGPFPYTVVESFFDSYYNSDELMDDDNWHYSCTDLQLMLIENLPLEVDQRSPRFHHILGMGLNTVPDPARRGFYVDEVSLSSERRSLFNDSYVAPTRPNGRSLHEVVTTTSYHGNNDTLGFDVTINMELVPSACISDLPLISVSLVEENVTEVLEFSFGRTQSASSPLSGNYSLGFKGQTTTGLRHDSTEQQIKEALEDLDGVGEVTISYSNSPLPHDILGNFCPGRSFSVQFETTAGDLPLIEINDQQLSGDDVTTTVTENKAGGLFLRPIPGHMLQTVETKPQVHVHVRGQLSACSGGHELYEEIRSSDHIDTCSFVYAPTATPTVSSVSPTNGRHGDSIQIQGTGFSSTPSENFVQFGNMGCEVTGSTSTQIDCELGDGFAGYKELYIHVTSSGVADTASNGLTYSITLDSVDVAEGSQAGGTSIVLSGSGFYPSTLDTGSDSQSLAQEYATMFPGNSCSSGWQNVVTVGDNSCEIIDSTLTTIACLTPEETGGATMYDITVSVGCPDNSSSYIAITLSNGFTYDSSLTPAVTSIAPTEGTVHGGESVVITGSGFGSDVTLLTVMLGGLECEITAASSTEVICTTPSHSQGTADVNVIVLGKGRASSVTSFSYDVGVSSVSHCTGSLFGGQLLDIDGNGFGADPSQVEVRLGSYPCHVTSLTDTEILCVTTPTTQTHQIDNNMEHPEYGLGYQWNPSSLTIHPGDTVRWSWTGSSFTSRRGVAQVNRPGDTEYNGEGFRSGRSVTGSFSQTFTKTGTYYYIADGFGEIGFNGTIIVTDLEDLSAPLSISINSVPIDLSDFVITCEQTSSPFTDYTYTVATTPVILTTSLVIASPGEAIEITMSGISDMSEDNVLIFGGRTPLSCSTTTPALVSSTRTSPDVSMAATLRSYLDTVTTIQCTLPVDIMPGRYRTLMHVAGRGWADAALDDTTVEVRPRIDSSPQVSSASLRGGLPLTISTTGLLPSSITNTRVVIGNTPCIIQSITPNGDLTCLTQAAVDDGYSSLVDRNSPVAYWSLQSDLHRSNGSYVGSDGEMSFSNRGSIGSVADATIVGEVLSRQEGISANSDTDQSAFFEASYLTTPGLQVFARPFGFSADFWLKSEQTVENYRIIFSSSGFEDGISRGYVVLLNPCNQIEFWVATGESLQSLSAGECEIITNTLYCSTMCNGIVRIPESSSLPSGIWHVTRNGHSDWTEWGHVYFGWNVDESLESLYSIWSDDDCTAGNLCNGVQTLAVNGDITFANTTFHRSLGAQTEIGGTSSLPVGDTNTVLGELSPFVGYLDEIGFYDRPLSQAHIEDRVQFGSSEDQPIWLTVEGVDGIGSGAAPNVEYPEWESDFNDEIVLDLDSLRDGVYVLDNSTAFRFVWTGLRGIREVSRSVYESCDLEAPYIQEWTPPTSGGTRTIWLVSGKTYYFIDPVVGGCLEGRKLSARVGNIEVIEWRVTTYSDITISEGTGLVFHWDGSVMHDLIEMKTAANSPSDCNKGRPSQRDKIGLVANEWQSVPSTSGEIALNSLSVGSHHFLCSVASHCVRGMRFTVNVVANGDDSTDSDSQDSNGPVVHTIMWRIQDYADLTMVEGDVVSFVWEGFHSLHQVTEDTYESCDLSESPLFEWGLPSVDNSVSIEGFVPGEYFFLCAVAGHCDAGMKIKVIVLPNDGLPVLSSGVNAVCADGVSCSIAYSVSSTPQLSSVEPTQSTGGSTLILRGSNILPPNTIPNTPLSDVTVWIDKAPCTNVMALSNDTESDHVISCDITDYESRYYHVDVYVDGKGYASVSPTQLVPGPLRNLTYSANFQSPYPKFFLAASVSSISPTSGSVRGGTLLTILGSGFSHISERNTADLGGVSCRILEASSAQITCLTGPSPASSVALSSTVNDFPVSTSVMFEYSSSSTPQVTTVSGSPDINSLSGGDTIQFSGTQLGSEASDVRVQIVSTFVDFSTENECIIDSFNSDPSGMVTITCVAPNKPAGSYELLVHVNGLGFASFTDSSVSYALEIDSFDPSEAGYGGGIMLTIDGSGFPELNSDSNSELFEQVSVTLCQGQSSSTTCRVGSSSLTQLTCVLDSTTVMSPFDTDTSCPLTIEIGGISQISGDSFQFLGSLTPRVDSISPSIGGTGGGATVTIEGSGFTSSSSDSVAVTIDNVVCETLHSNDTTLTCLTGNHSTTLQAEVKVQIPGKGNALSSGDPITYEYVDLWSSEFTWGGGPLPAEGDSVYIKVGQTVFLDVNTPVLNLVLIEGELIFQDEQDQHLQAKYIFINTGKLQVGTEDSPFSHSAKITLHGSITDPEIPIYGAKVLGIRQGELDLHGRPRAVTWTRLDQTASGNATSLRLQEAVDWVTGDNIVIAPTGKDGNETEDNEVLSVSGDGRTVNLVRPLKYTHHGITDTYDGGHSIEIRAEVGLLSHNVIVQGAQPLPTENEVEVQYGSQIFVHRTGPHPTPIRIEHTEIRYGGQAFRLGRYAVHFHLSGSMAGSYVRNCAIHHSNNRAITAHGVHDLLIEGNVAYDIKGHTFFVEDGIETNNRYINNLGVLTRGSSSLLNTDQIPATFWITNPQNTFIGNAAAASRAYGFWYDLDPNPSGASRTSRVCPNKEPFGVFQNNTAHTCNEFGLRIWETYVPFADGCGASQHEVATLTDFTTYANGINGVELSIVGHVRLVGFKVADNVQNGIVIIETLGEWGGPKIENALIISHSSANSGEPQTGGIKTPNTPRLTVSNVTFANFDLPSTSCLKACSHCKVRQGGFQVWFEQLSFVGGSADHKAAFQWEYEVLYKDLDGTLTGQPGGGWVLPDSDLIPPQYCVKSQPEFSINHTVINGTVCTSDINFLRMAWNQAQPLATLEDVAVNVSNQFGNSTIPWRHYRLTHLDGYMFTMPDGYDHRLVWDTPIEHRVDHTSYNAGVYGIRPGTSHWVTHEFIQTPDHVNVGGNHEPTEHGGLPTDMDSTFSWHLENETDPDTVTYFISGRNLTDQNNNVTFHYSYEPCPRDGCPPPAIDYGNYESFQRRWSDPESWPSNQIPQEGEDVTISSRWRMLLDVSPPTLGKVYILGELIFEDERDYNFTTDLVRILIQGEMARVFIGTEDEPFTHKVVITMNGQREDDPLVLSRRLNFGSKGIGVFGNLSIHGVPRATWTRLGISALAGSDSLQLQGNDYPNWGVGDEIVVAPSGWDPEESEIRTITAYDRRNGAVSLNEPLVYDHLVQPFLEPTDLDLADPPLVGGATPWWGDGGTMAPEVGLLSHNIIIQGGEDPSQPLEVHHYGCRILVGEYVTGSHVFDGRLNIDSVEIRYCGQGGYFSPRDPRYAIAFANSFETSAGSYIRRSSIHHGYNTAIGVHTSYGIEISQNVIWRTVDSGLKVGGRDNTVVDNLAMLTSTIQPNRPSDNHAVDFPATFDIDGNNIVRGNAAAGSTRIAFRYSGERCLEGNTAPTYDEAMFWDNTAHSGFIGLVVLGLPNDCTAIGGFTSVYQWNYGVFSSTASSLVTTHFKIGIGKVGLNLNIFGPNPVAHLLGKKSISISDSLLVGSLPGESCDTRRPSFLPSISFGSNDHKLGVMMSSFNQRRSKMDGTGAWHLMKGYPVVDGVVNTNGLSFARFIDSGCNYNTVAIGNNPLSPDAVHPMHTTGTNKLNVDLNNVAFFYEPNPEWIKQEDCVDMDCDGPKHALIRDIDGRLVNTYPTQGSIIPFAELRFANYSARLPVIWLAQDREDGSLAQPEEVLQYRGIARGETGNLDSSAGGCVWMGAWQGYRCKTLQHHMLVIESLDEDTETRRLSPLALNGGDTGAGHYTDLINGPMDHGWCVYYTCLKRLSTFFTVIAVGTDYCIWMTGSPPTTVRFHLLNAGTDDTISMCIFFKDTRRKDVYKNNIFIEPENVRYLVGGGVQQIDGSYKPSKDGFGGANYFERESQFLYLIIKGNDPIEIRTPPVVQVSLSLAVSLDDFFNVGDLIKNLAFVLKIDPGKIRIVKIVAENSVRRRRSLLTETGFNHTTITLEFGDPPAPNITAPPPPTVAQEIMMAGETNDSVDLDDHTAVETPLNGTNPLNEDPPDSVESFADNFNVSVVDYIDEVELYEDVLAEIEEVNELAGQVVDLVLTGEIANITNATVTGLSVVPATPPPSPPPPVIPPVYENATTDEGDPVVIPIEEVIELPTIVAETTDNGTADGNDDGTVTINFIIPSEIRVTMEPYEETGHLVHVAVTVFDDNGDPVVNLGLVNPWLCEATLVHSPEYKTGSQPELGGVTRVPFVQGVAEFTRLRIDGPGQELTLSFRTVPTRFQVSTSVSFSVVLPYANTTREKIGFLLEGDTSVLPGDEEVLTNAVMEGLSLGLDVDISRIENLTVEVTSQGVSVTFDLLDRQPTDPPNVLSLYDAISSLMEMMDTNSLMITIVDTPFTAVPGSFEYVTPPLPTHPSIITQYRNVFIAVGSALGVFLLLIVVLVLFFVCTRTGKTKGGKKDEDEGKIPLHPIRRVTPMPPGNDNRSDSGESDEQLDLSMFVQGPPSRLSNYRDSPLNVPDGLESFVTDETSLGTSDYSGYTRSSVDCWDGDKLRPPSNGPNKLSQSSRGGTPVTIAGLAKNPSYADRRQHSSQKPTSWAVPASGNHSNQPAGYTPVNVFVVSEQKKRKRSSGSVEPMSPGWY